MRARAFTGTLLLIVLALCANLAFSQAPQGFSYQAVIRNTSGTVIPNQNVSLRFSLISAGGTTLYAETQAVTTTANGIVNLNIGTGTVTSGTFASIPWSSGDIRLKVEVDPTGGTSYTEMGTTRLYSVPYAFFASNGPAGPAGNGIASVTDNGNGTLTLHFDNGASYITPNLIGPQGPQGLVGPTGPQGIQGVAGSAGSQGLQGPIGPTGAQGAQGPAGPKGDKGDAGTGLTNRGAWASGTTYNPSDYVFAESTGNASVNSMWIMQASAAFSSTIQPKNDNTKWVEFQAPQGPAGPIGPIGPKGDLGSTGPQGAQGVQGFQGQQGPVGPQGLQGLQGATGANGLSIVWKGESASPISSPSTNWAYYNTADKKSYIWDGSAWATLVKDGLNGINGISIVWKGESATPIASPSTNWAYYNTVEKKSYVYDGSSWTIVAQDGAPGPVGPLVAGVAGQTLVHNGTTWAATNAITVNGQNVGIGTTTPLTKLVVKSETNSQVDDPIFEVRNKDNKVVLGVYNEGVRVYVADSPTSKGARGGFAVGGLTNQNKGTEREYLRITPDSARIYINDKVTGKGARGGFAVGGLTNQNKGVTNNYLYIHRDSARIYINDTSNTTKGARGGFAVGGLTNQNKGKPWEFMRITKDSSRIYIDDAGKGARGGFAVGGLTNQNKGGSANFFNIETGITSIINPSEPRVLWYPLKNAFLTGQVLIEHPDSIGLNSFSSGYESKAKGQYSIVAGYQARANGDWAQAFGYKTFAKGSYSTALGNGSIASGESSFAIGFQSNATGRYASAFGANCVASGTYSTASGYYSTASGGNAFAFGLYSTAEGSSSLAIGWQNHSAEEGSTAIGVGCYAGNKYAFALGYACWALGETSYAFGYLSKAHKTNSYVFGKSSEAQGISSYAFGESVIAGSETSQNCYAFGKQSQAIGNASYAFGNGALASGSFATAFGKNSSATNTSSFSFGNSSHANGASSYAFGDNVTAGSISNGNCYAFGKNTQAIGDGSYAFGDGAIANAQYATAFGKLAQATNTSAFAFGESAQASSTNSFALGKGAFAYGPSCYAFGESAQASNLNSFALGKGANASGESSFAFGTWGQDYHYDNGVVWGTNTAGSYTQAVGNYSFAAGQGAKAIGDNSISIGFCTLAEGALNIAMGYGSHSFGNRSPIAIGEYCSSSGIASVAMGWWASAIGAGSVAMGYSAKSSAAYCASFGKFNLGLSNSIFEIGNGSGESSRYNVFTILDNGYTGIGTSQPIRNLHVASGSGSSEFILENLGGQANWRKWNFAVYDGNGTPGLPQNLYLRIMNDAGNAISKDAMTWLYNGNVGIGTKIPDYPLDVKGRARFMSSGAGNTAGFWLSNYSGADKAFVGLNNDNGDYVGFYGAGAVGWGLVMNQNNGCVGIGVATPTFRLELPNNSDNSVGRARAYAWDTYSDSRIKVNQEILNYGLRELLLLQPKKYQHYSSTFKNNQLVLNETSSKEEIGLVAQDVYNVIPEVVSKPDDENKDLWSMNYDKLIPVLIKGIQEQQEMINELKKNNEELKNKIAELEEIKALLKK